MTQAESGWLFAAGVDLGLTRDNSAVVVLAIPAVGNHYGRVRLAHHRVWKPLPGKKVDLMEVEAHILALDKKFNLQAIGIDVWQAELLAARLEHDSQHRRRSDRKRFWAHSWVYPITATGANLQQQASLTLEFFNDRRLALYPCPPLLRDLQKLRVEECDTAFA